MIRAAVAIWAASGLSAPSGGMDMVRHLLSNLPDVNETRQSAGADVDLWITPDGRIASCEIPRSAGDQELIRLICPALEGYSVGSAKDASGNNIHADISLPITAFPDRIPSLRNRMNSQLARLREVSSDERYFQLNSVRWRADWQLLVEIDENGRITDCIRASREVSESSAEQACTAIAKRKFAPRSDAGGNPVRYVKTLTARPS